MPRIPPAFQRLYTLPILLGSLFCVGIYTVWLLFPITIITADIGRHITDGQVLLGYPELRSMLLSTNFYSLATPDYEIINHHWASGIAYALVHGAFGWKGIHILQILLGLTALGLVTDIARRKSSVGAALLVTLCLLPIIAYRHEIRPEYFGYAFLGIIFWLLNGLSEKRISVGWLWALPLLMLAWINMHASFPLGIGLIGLFALQAYLQKSPYVRPLLLTLGASVAILIFNPAGIAGVLYPLNILRDPGYAVLENQSFRFLGSIGITNWTFTSVYILAVLLPACIAVLAWKRKIHDMLPHVLFAMFALLMAWFAVRHITLLGFVLIPVFAATLSLDVRSMRMPRVVVLTVGCIAVLLAGGLQVRHLQNRWIVLGLEPTANDAAEFLSEHDIRGPIMNNFDIAGYLIYHFFPKERPFVYNRPESHPSEFWRSVYIPMMQDESIWYAVLNEFSFNVIVMFHGDKTPWAQQFLGARIRDPEWEAVFVDRSIIILLRATEGNGEVIREFGIPSENLIDDGV